MELNIRGVCKALIDGEITYLEFRNLLLGLISDVEDIPRLTQIAMLLRRMEG